MIANFLTNSCIVEYGEHDKNTYKWIDTHPFSDYYMIKQTRQMVNATIL